MVGGLIMVITGSRSSGATQGPIVNNNLGYLLAFAAGLTFGVASVITKHVVSVVASPLVTSAFTFLIGVGMLLILTHRGVVRSIHQVHMRYIGICALGGVCQGLAIIFLFQALSRAPVTVVAPVAESTPLVVLGLSALFLRRLEGITPILTVGTVLSLAGVVIIIVGAGL